MVIEAVFGAFIIGFGVGAYTMHAYYAEAAATAKQYASLVAGKAISTVSDAAAVLEESKASITAALSEVKKL